MATPRKTIQVEQVLNFVNTQLRCDHWSADEKKGMYIVLDRILHDTDQYAGFNYLDSYNPEDPDFQIGGNKEVSRQYYLKTNTFSYQNKVRKVWIMILDAFNVYRGTNCSDALIEISLSIRQILAKSMSFDERWYPDSTWLIMDKEEDREYKVFDL